MVVFLILQAFLLATVISFAGSVQLGPVNFGTIQTALNKDLKSALRFGFGGSLPELLYCGLAIGGSNLLEKTEGLGDTLKYVTSAILFIFGIYLLLQKPKEGGFKEKKGTGNEIWMGMTFGLFNPQLFPFWLIIITNLRSYNIMVSDLMAEQVAFAVGTAFGAFLLQYLVAVITIKKRDFLFSKVSTNFNHILGVIIIGVGLLQVILTLV